MNFQGHIQKGMVILDRPLPLPDGTRVRVEPLSSLPGDFWQSLSLDELASLQGVSTPETFKELVGGWPSDELDDDFEKVFKTWRERELEQPCMT